MAPRGLQKKLATDCKAAHNPLEEVVQPLLNETRRVLRSFCLNHMTTPSMSFIELVRTAAALGCSGVEVRNDLNTELFDGITPEEAKATAEQQGVHIIAVAEVPAFNDGSDRALHQLHELSDLASRCGAHGVSLIPWLADGHKTKSTTLSREAVVEQLSNTLADFAPILAKHQLIGFIEPLGFEHASIRLKAEVVEVIESTKLNARFQLVHDTFHHYLADEAELFPEHTGLVHVSGVVSTDLSRDQLTDTHRGLVNSEDRLGNLEQLRLLKHGGYRGPVSIEAFAPAVHNLKKPEEELLTCFNHIGPSMQTVAA